MKMPPFCSRICLRAAASSGAALACLFAVVSAHAQIGGLIVDAADQPLSGVTVELWAGTQPLTRVQSDGRGAFAIESVPAATSLSLTFRRIGLRTAMVSLSQRDTFLNVKLSEQVVSLETVVVSAGQHRLCPRREDPRARLAWEAMRRRYWQPSTNPLDSVRVIGFAEFRSGSGSKMDISDPLAGTTFPGWEHTDIFAGRDRFLPLQGYAYPSPPVHIGDRNGAWSYHYLEEGAAQDFTQEYFGSVHALFVVGENRDGMVIGFCPTERLGDRGQIEGTLTLSSTGLLIRSQWRFRTKPPVENAEGEVRYYPPDPATGSLLLAQEAGFWRQSSPGRFYFQYRSFTNWRHRDEVYGRGPIPREVGRAEQVLGSVPRLNAR